MGPIIERTILSLETCLPSGDSPVQGKVLFILVNVLTALVCSSTITSDVILLPSFHSETELGLDSYLRAACWEMAGHSLVQAHPALTLSS